MNTSYDGFISYGRLDSKTFATYLHKRLLEQGLNIWFDQNDIPLGVDFQNQIDDGIEKADNFLYIIAPHSINSPYCGKEVDLALRRNKRIIPLLHVEQISQETWQQRNPTGSQEQWEAYKAKGLHSSHPNMHPAIGKINWVYFREEIDDFEKSFAGLIELIHRDREYVQRHTYFLTRSLEWERNQKQTQYLLLGQDRLQAEQWLQTRFENRQPPCEPSDLHCEYICESIQNANNLATHVFLSHSEKDNEIRDKIRRSLMRQSLTVWTNKADIKTGAEFQAEINHGIEAADTLVFMISPASLESVYCQQELNYAFQLNKRIIPLLVEPTNIDDISPKVRSLQFIDFTTRVDEANYRVSVDKLLKALQEDAHYYVQHKILLTRALKWESQNRNPSILLRGHNLRQAEAWFKLAKPRSQHPPTALQEEFITTSLQQPPEASLDVFVSYSRADSDFARRLNDALQMQGKTTWFDQESIDSGSDFQQEIYRGIENSNSFLFVISPNSVNSPYCADEVEYAKKLGKRIITVLYQAVTTTELHPVLASIQWIDFNRYDKDFYANFGELIRALDTNLDYTRLHTRLLLKAMEWQRSQREPDYLLRGKDLKEAEQWLQSSAGLQPAPSELHKDYIRTSRNAPLPKPKLGTVAITSVIVTIVTLTLRSFGLFQSVELALYDEMMRRKPIEPMDDRILVVGINENDIQAQIEAQPTKGWGTMPDETILELMNRLQAGNPRVIGMDMDRDFPTYVPALSDRFRNDSNLVFVCRHPGEEPEDEEVRGARPPSELTSEQVETRVGFSDSVLDYDDVLRRHLVMDAYSGICPVSNAFSLMVAQTYLEAEQQPYGRSDDAEDDYVQLGSTVFPYIYPGDIGYQQSDLEESYQILLNYRRSADGANKFVEQVSLYDVLDGRVSPEQIRDRIVLIGITSRQTVRDYAGTPYGEMAGVLIQAQMVSQFVSATLDGRPLIWWSPAGDALWILGWAVVGGAIVWRIQRSTTLVLVGVGTSALLVGLCWTVFALQSGWLPLFPALITLLATGAISLFITYQFRK